MDYLDVSEKTNLKSSQERKELKRKYKKQKRVFINKNMIMCFIFFILFIFILIFSIKKYLQRERNLLKSILTKEKNISNLNIIYLKKKYNNLKREYELYKNISEAKKKKKKIDKSNYKIVAISYGNDRFTEALKYNQQSALEIAKVNEYYGYGPENIDKDFKEKNNNILSEPRGNGYWLWKPYFILKTFKEKLNEGDYLIYSDAGTLFIDKAQKIVDFINEKKVDMYLHRNPHLERQYTKRDAFILLGVDSPFYSETGQFNAAFQIYKKTRFTEIFLEEYLYYSQDRRIITDDPNKLGKENYNEFKDHRHDQSILSLLTKKYGQVNANKANVDINIAKNFEELMPTIFCHFRRMRFDNFSQVKEYCNEKDKYNK